MILALVDNTVVAILVPEINTSVLMERLCADYWNKLLKRQNCCNVMA